MMTFALLLLFFPTMIALHLDRSQRRGDWGEIERVANWLLRTPGAAQALRAPLLRQRAVARLALRRAAA